MKRFALVVLSICTTAILISTSGRYFLPRADAFESLGFGLCQQKPCFLNLVPGETSWTETLALLKPYRQVRFTNTFGVIIDGQTVLADSFSRPRGSLDEISIWLPLRSFSIGDAIEDLGTPCGVSFYPMTPLQCVPPGACRGLFAMEIRYESLVLQVNLRRDGAYPQAVEITRVDPDLPVRSLALVNPAKFAGTATVYCHISPTMDERIAPGTARVDTPWLGFASTRRYLDYARRAGT